MYTFLSFILFLVFGYFVYGRFVEKKIGISNRKTPAYTHKDGIDYIPMNRFKNAFIQLLNIAGVGPIFGPIMGALYGPVAFLWIVLGAVFAGAVHDYLIGMISLRNQGMQLPKIAALVLGKPFSHVVNFFSVLLLVLVGAAFVMAPASMIHGLINQSKPIFIYIASAIFVYYILATLLPIDKIIGRIYPFLGGLLLVSAFAICLTMLIFHGKNMPEISLENIHPKGLPLYPIIFLTISCGALSGFHATQTPIIARTLNREQDGRMVFYGMMILEAIIAMIWAAAAMSVIDRDNLIALLEKGSPAAVVKEISVLLLGSIGGSLAVIAIIILPITSGDTSFRAARIIISEYLNVDQKKLKNRLFIALPLFFVAIVLLNVDFALLWRYFSWANQVMASISLWIATGYLYKQGKAYWIALLPALFMSTVVVSYILYDSKVGFNLNLDVAKVIGLFVSMFFLIGLFRLKQDRQTQN